MEKQHQINSKIIQYLQKNKQYIRQLHDVKYAWCICDVLDQLQIKIFEQNLKDYPDIQKNVYEGGFKIWECEIDGLNFFAEQKLFQNKTILELGCGSGLIGIDALLKGASLVYFQDYNKQVLQYHTMVNLQLQQDSNLMNKTKFIYGSWNDISQKKQQLLFAQENMPINSIDIIIGGDILYEIQHYQDLVDIFDMYLRKDGCAFIITKMYYFGNGGSYYEFEDFINKDKRFICTKQKYQKEKVGGNKRVIIKLARKSN